MTSSSRRGKPLLQTMLNRYLAIPDVEDWLMSREPCPENNFFSLETSFSYACMYYPPIRIPLRTDRYPCPQPFLDMGDVLLCHHVYDGIAVGKLHNKKEKHALSTVFDYIMKDSKYFLSGRPRTRNFAVDLRVNQLEVVEFAWMEDNSLIIACRRLVESPTGEQRLVLSADLLFYAPIPPGCTFHDKFLLLRTSLDERTVACDFCAIQGYQSCTCPRSLRREVPGTWSKNASSDAVVTMRDPKCEPKGLSACAIGSWDNFTKKIFRFAQTGTFFVNSMKRALNGKMVPVSGPKHAIQYRFVCGHRDDTMRLVRCYAQRTGLCDGKFLGDTFLYGNGISRGSCIGMLMDKNDEISHQRDMPQANEIFSNTSTVNSYSQDDDKLSIEISNHATAGTVPSQSALSNVTVSSNEYDSLYTSPYEVAPPMGTDMGSFSNTTPNEDSPNSVLLDQDEGWMSNWGIPEVPPEGLRQPRGVPSNELTGPNQDLQPVINDQPRSQPRPLSISSQLVQAYITENESRIPTCRECGKSFPKRGNLARHIQTVHLKMKPFSCDQCPAHFGYNAHLKRHMSIHRR